jgi:hypothetical protein
MLNYFKGITTLKCHGRVNVVEVMKYLELGPNTINNLWLEETNVDLTKLFVKHRVKPGDY